ncbi:unnamed protein product, partial [Prorocentrum cordatum]
KARPFSFPPWARRRRRGGGSGVAQGLAIAQPAWCLGQPWRQPSAPAEAARPARPRVAALRAAEQRSPCRAKDLSLGRRPLTLQAAMALWTEVCLLAGGDCFTAPQRANAGRPDCRRARERCARPRGWQAGAAYHSGKDRRAGGPVATDCAADRSENP